MAFFLNSYRPLIHTWFGRQAVQQHNLPPFLDASCRREPDFENPFPSMTAICRGSMGAVRLQENDYVAYITVKDRYQPAAPDGRYLVGGFRVIKRCDSHEAAAMWYTIQGYPVPRNCFVPDNGPLAYELTGGHAPNTTRELKQWLAEPEAVRQFHFEQQLSAWDTAYQAKVDENGTFIITEPIQLNYHTPPLLTDEYLLGLFGRIPATRSTREITPDQFWALMDRLQN